MRNIVQCNIFARKCMFCTILYSKHQHDVELVFFAPDHCDDAAGQMVNALPDAFRRLEAYWQHFATVVLAAVQHNHVDRALFTDRQAAEVETFGTDAQLVGKTNGKLPLQRFLRAYACALKRNVKSLARLSIHDGAAFVELAALALGVETQHGLDGMAGEDGNAYGSREFDTTARRISLDEGHRLGSGIAQTELAPLRAVRLVDCA